MSTAAFGGQPLWLWAYAGYGRRAGRRVPGMFLYVLIGISQLPEKLEFVGMRERKTFPLGGRWHGEAVTDEGKRRDFLGGNDKREKVRRCTPDSV